LHPCFIFLMPFNQKQYALLQFCNQAIGKLHFLIIGY